MVVYINGMFERFFGADCEETDSPCVLGSPNTPKLWVGRSFIVANAVSMPREWFPKTSEFIKRNWPGAARI